MGEGILKPFIELQGRTVLERVVQTFLDTGRFENIVVLANPLSLDLYLSTLEKFGSQVKIEPGGSTRQESVRLGLEFLEKCISPAEANYVAVHDAARCLISKQLIVSALEVCLEQKAVTLGIPVADSMFKASEKGKSLVIESAVDRKNLYAIQTPQVFEYKLILERHRHFFQTGRNDFTDDCALLEGVHEVYIAPGSKNNLKITTKDDLAFATAILESSEL